MTGDTFDMGGSGCSNLPQSHPEPFFPQVSSINTIKILGKSNKITRKVKNCDVTAKFLFLMLLENYSSTGLHGKPWHGQ